MRNPSAIKGSHDGFIKMDFHVHTPVSLCYQDRMAPELGLRTRPEDIVDAALVAGLDALVISDHNAVAAIESIRKVASAQGLVLFPGMELSAQGGHLLALFDPAADVAHLSRLLDLLEFPEAERGNGSYSTHYWLDQCAERVEALGGLAIAAHVDREPRGFIASDYDRGVKQRLHNSEFLTALEITDPRAKAEWEHGKIRHFPKPYPVVQGSDAHAPHEIGRRPTYLRLSELSLTGLRQAIQDYSECVRFPGELGG